MTAIRGLSCCRCERVKKGAVLQKESFNGYFGNEFLFGVGVFGFSLGRAVRFRKTDFGKCLDVPLFPLVKNLRIKWHHLLIKC